MWKNGLYLALSLMLSLFLSTQTWACTNFLVTQGASEDGSTMITYAADSHVLFGELYFSPAADHPEGSMLEIYEWDTGKYLGKIAQVAHTYTVIGNMNENQVSIGETTYGGRKALQKNDGSIMDYGSLIYVTLQRAENARHAIEIMTTLVEEYGYYSSGESFSIADPDEVWIMEMIGKGEEGKDAVWVARKIPDGYISGHANQARITTFPLDDEENCLYSDDVIEFARDQEYYEGRKDKGFSFRDAYAPLDFGGARFCEARVWAGFRKVADGMDKYEDYARGENLDNTMPLWVKPKEKINVHDVMEMMRDHFEGSSMDMTKDMGAGPYDNPYRWRPLTWEVDDKTYFNERAISTQQTGFSFVAQMRSWLPDPIGGIHWFGVDDAYSTVYMPLYAGMVDVPERLILENRHKTWYSQPNRAMFNYDRDHAFWIFNRVSNWAYTRYNAMIPTVRDKQKELEMKFIQYTPAIDQAAKMLYEKDEALAREFLTDYSINTVNQTLDAWQELEVHLFTKFMDGNVKTPNDKKRNPNLDQPGYGEEWYKKILEETDDKFEYHGSH